MSPEQKDESPFKIPESAQPGVDEAIDTFSKEFDRRQANHPETAGQTRETLIREGIGKIALSAEEIEAREAEELAAARRQAQQNSKPSKKRRKYRRRGRDPKGGGPPPHISAEIRGEPKD